MTRRVSSMSRMTGVARTTANSFRQDASVLAMRRRMSVMISVGP